MKEYINTEKLFSNDIQFEADVIVAVELQLLDDTKIKVDYKLELSHSVDIQEDENLIKNIGYRLEHFIGHYAYEISQIYNCGYCADCDLNTCNYVSCQHEKFQYLNLEEFIFDIEDLTKKHRFDFKQIKLLEVIDMVIEVEAITLDFE